MRANRTSEISVSNKTQALDSNDGVLPFTLTSEFPARPIAQLCKHLPARYAGVGIDTLFKIILGGVGIDIAERE